MMQSQPFHPFAVEQFLSEMEHGVQFNFSESGVHPVSYAELFALAQIDTDSLFSTLVDYPEVNGFRRLRQRISDMYTDIGPENVLVTVGATEANTLVAQTLLQPGDNMVRFCPTYEQLPGNALNRGVEVRNVPMIEEQDWAIDGGALDAAVDQKTRLIHIVNPNNPTGRVLGGRDRHLIVAAAERVGAWIVADEVYIGTERNTDEPTQSFWGTSERVVIVNSMSKAYGLPGLRLGWLIAPTEIVTAFWRRHEYASISASMMSMKLAEYALSPGTRAKLTERARQLIRRGFETLTEELSRAGSVFSVVPPDASAMSFVKLDLQISSDAFAQRLLKEKDVLVIPGSKFGLEGHFRFSSALPDPHLREGLGRLLDLTDDVRQGSAT